MLRSCIGAIASLGMLAAAGSTEARTGGAVQQEAVVGNWIGAVRAGEAYAPLQVAIPGPSATETTVQSIGFTFLGFGAVHVVGSEARDRDLLLTLRDWSGAEHVLSGTATEDTIAGAYESETRRGSFHLVRFDGPAPQAALEPLSGVYRRDDGSYVLVRAAPEGHLRLTDYETGWMRRAVPTGEREFTHGAANEDWSAPQGTASFVTAPDGEAPRLVWDRRDQRGGREVRVARRVELEERTVRFVNGETVLAGTLILPPKPGPHPAFVFVHGSGAATRETHREVAVHFVTRGFAALIYDKRGTGESTGNWEIATREELADDAVAAARLLRTTADIDPDGVGIYGLSQGGWIAPLAVARSDEFAFLVTVSAPGFASDEQELFRRTLNLRGIGYIPGPAFAREEVETARAVMREFFAYVKTGVGGAAVSATLARERERPWFSTAELPERLDPDDPPDFIEGFRSGMNFDVTRVWSEVDVPALLLYGALDPFVPAEASVASLRDALAANSAAPFDIRLFADADHWMLRRSPDDTRGPTTGYVPGYLATIAAWLASISESR